MPNSPTPELPTGQRLNRQLGRQGAMLFSGFAVAQICSFARNAVIGYWLSRGDFGIAATITIALQMLETLSDLGADRLLVQAVDGDDPRLMAAAHATLVMRGILTAALLFMTAGFVVEFFGIADAKSAFQLASLVPLIKSLMHLDSRRQQRGLQNRNYMIVEVLPQAIALLVTVPCLYLTRNYSAVVWVAILQALLSVLLSQLLAKRPYVLGLETEPVKRLIAFGWPIWLSAFPLVVVYQGDRVIVGRLLGMDALAGYSAAFMVAMVPGLLAAKIGHALFLPLLSAKRGDARAFFQRYLVMFEGTSIAAAAYVVAFVVAGGDVMPLAFGPHYVGLGGVISFLAAMWALRMVQSIPGMALMAQGETRPLLIAGIIRASALILAWCAVTNGLGLTGVAAAGVAGEFITITYILLRTARGAAGIARATFARAMFPILAGATAAACAWTWPVTGSLWVSGPVALVLCVSATLFGLAVMPGIRLFIETQIDGHTATAPATENTASAEGTYVATRA
ncbi:MAG: oligosaccharide flippase family protein [Hyphomicrobiaceae bacterium]